MYIRKPLKIGLVAPGQFSGPRLESGPSLSLNHLPTASGWAKKSLTLSGGVNPIRHQSTEAIPGPPPDRGMYLFGNSGVKREVI